MTGELKAKFLVAYCLAIVLACAICFCAVYGAFRSTSDPLARAAAVRAERKADAAAGEQNLGKLAIAEVAREASGAGITVTGIRVVRVKQHGTDAKVYVAVDTLEVGHVNLVVKLSKSNWSVAGVTQG